LRDEGTQVVVRKRLYNWALFEGTAEMFFSNDKVSKNKVWNVVTLDGWRFLHDGEIIGGYASPHNVPWPSTIGALTSCSQFPLNDALRVPVTELKEMLYSMAELISKTKAEVASAQESASSLLKTRDSLSKDKKRLTRDQCKLTHTRDVLKTKLEATRQEIEHHRGLKEEALMQRKAMFERFEEELQKYSSHGAIISTIEEKAKLESLVQKKDFEHSTLEGELDTISASLAKLGKEKKAILNEQRHQEEELNKMETTKGKVITQLNERLLMAQADHEGQDCRFYHASGRVKKLKLLWRKAVEDANKLEGRIAASETKHKDVVKRTAREKIYIEQIKDEKDTVFRRRKERVIPKHMTQYHKDFDKSVSLLLQQHNVVDGEEEMERQDEMNNATDEPYHAGDENEDKKGMDDEQQDDQDDRDEQDDEDLALLGKILKERQSQLRHASSEIDPSVLDTFTSLCETQKKILANACKIRRFGMECQQKANETQIRRFVDLSHHLKTICDQLSVVYSQLVPQAQCYLSYVDNPKSLFVEGVSIIAQYGNSAWRESSMLSGGQKAACSLSLIIAIQDTSPSSLYLIDEIDAALDVRTVERVADVFHKRTLEGANLIICSHRPEMILRCTRCLGIYAGAGESGSDGEEDVKEGLSWLRPHNISMKF